MRRGAAVRALLVLLAIAAAPWSIEAQRPPAGSAPPMPKRLRIALVPLDDRPVCLQYPQMMAGLAHAEVVAPPVAVTRPFHHARRHRRPSLAGCVTRTGAASTRSSSPSTCWRTAGSSRPACMPSAPTSRSARLSVLEEIRKTHPALPIYGFSVIMRLAPTADGTNDGLAREAGSLRRTRAGDEGAARRPTRSPRSARQIPAAAARRTTARHAPATAASIWRPWTWWRARSWTTSSCRRTMPSREACTWPIGPRIRRIVCDKRRSPHASASSRAPTRWRCCCSREPFSQRRDLSAAMRATYSSEQARTMVAPFEDRPLHETVGFQLVAAGARRDRRDRRRLDLRPLRVRVAARRRTAPQGVRRPTSPSRCSAAHRAIVADVDPKGDVQGASPAFTEALLAAKLFPELYGYASWNTAGNTLGTAIPHGLLAWAGARLAMRCTSPASRPWPTRRSTFLLHRLVNDYAYQGVLRPVINSELRAAGRDAAWLRAHSSERGGARSSEVFEPKLTEYAQQFTPGYMPPAPGPTDIGVQVARAARTFRCACRGTAPSRRPSRSTCR